jgi:hypothetical protein
VPIEVFGTPVTVMVRASPSTSVGALMLSALLPESSATLNALSASATGGLLLGGIAVPTASAGSRAVSPRATAL